MKDIEMGGACGMRRTNAYNPKKWKCLGELGLDRIIPSNPVITTLVYATPCL
jgi:hypothetical protein